MSLYKIAFASLRGLNPTLGEAVLARVGSEEEFFSLSADRLSTMMGFRNRLFDGKVRETALAEARIEEEFVERNSIRALYFTDDDYPARLRECEDAPLMLYALGDCDLNAIRVVSVVGTRHATTYGEGFVADLVEGLKRECADPVVIVSGLAYGIDSAAHRAALNTGVPTVGVLAHGLNTIYPAAHRDLAARMVRESGALVTDYRSTDAIHKGNFLARNRIVAGLCDCLVVAESDTHGGALVTARLASDYSRDVFALPGRTSDRYSRGCNRLIANSTASLVTNAGDLIDAMGWPRRPEEGMQTELFSPESPQLSGEERAIMAFIADRGEATATELRAHVDMPLPRLMGTLIEMEFRSLLLSIPGGRYRIK